MKPDNPARRFFPDGQALYVTESTVTYVSVNAPFASFQSSPRERLLEAIRLAEMAQPFFERSTSSSTEHFVDKSEIAAHFDYLSSKWRRERGRGIGLQEMCSLDSYQRIIHLGKPVIPFILRELKNRPDHWFWALHEITGLDDVVKEQHRGNIPKMSQDWIEWGRRNGYAV